MNRSNKVVVVICHLLLAAFDTCAQPGVRAVPRLEAMLDSLILARMKADHIPGAAFIIVRGGQVLLKKGYGYATLGAGGQKVHPDSTLFRIGSISKTFTATAVMQLAARKELNLHQDVNTYLTDLKVHYPFSTPVTPAHLLSHSAGFDELGKGRVVYAKSERIPLATFLQNRLVQVRPAGVVPAYSTYGIALAGLLVENVSRLPLEAYFKKNIWGPLGMNRTCIEVPASLQPHVATGYEYEDGQNTPQPWEWYHTFPASSINSTVSDMGRYMQMHLNAGRVHNNRILRKTSARQMQQQQLSVHPQADGFGYGFYKEDWQGLSTFDHGGDMAGFSAYMVLAREENLGIFIVHHHENTNLRREVVAAIVKHLYPAPGKPVPFKSPSVTTDATDFAGTYRWLSNCLTCPGFENQQTWEMKRNADGTLTGFKRTYVQVEPLLFRSTDGKSTMGFKKDRVGNVQYMTLGNVNVFEKVKWKQ